MGVLGATGLFLRALLVPRLHLVAENLALRQQLAVVNQSVKRVKLRPCDRLFWVLLRRFWSGWQSVLVIVQPETVVRWHRLGFRLYWRWKSTWGKRGRPKIARELRELIGRMSRENVTWGSPRIAAELRLLGYDLCNSTVAKYMVRADKPPSQTWRMFLANHAQDIAACDFFTVPTATFRMLYCFVVICHDSRRVVHFNVTIIRPPGGRRNRSSAPFRTKNRHATFSVTMTASTAKSSSDAFKAWVSKKSERRCAPLGRTRTRNALSARFAENVWIT